MQTNVYLCFNDELGICHWHFVWRPLCKRMNLGSEMNESNVSLKCNTEKSCAKYVAYIFDKQKIDASCACKFLLTFQSIKGNISLVKVVWFLPSLAQLL